MIKPILRKLLDGVEITLKEAEILQRSDYSFFTLEPTRLLTSQEAVEWSRNHDNPAVKKRLEKDQT